MRTLYTADEIKKRTIEMARDISEDYRGKKPLFICILKGAVIFLSDLVRYMDIDVEIDFIAVSSYGEDTKSSGVVRIQKDLDQSIKGKDIIIVEDIIDTGLTLNYLYKMLKGRDPLSLKVVTLLDKPERRIEEFTPDYCGFIVPDYFLVGYGLDCAEKYRQLPDLCILD